ncbi:MAG: glycosyltransferase [Paludibacteraceae bacterium]|nr:glycosyltransferase [Paludibacteraceae bacterium]
METEYKYMVMIKCFTYQHVNYIEDTLKGFVMQRTDFLFVAVVVDDCSTDGTADIVRKYAEQYPNIIHAICLEENFYSQQKPKFPLYQDIANSSKYIALCEGDDYWTDPLKLQKQVDLLEADETLVACCTNCSVVDMTGDVVEEKRILPVVRDNKSGRYSLRDFFDQSHQYPTLSVVYRNTHKKEVAEKCKIMRNPYMGDWTLWIALLCFGNMYYLDEVTCAYRINPQSLTHDQSKINQRRLGQAQDNFRLIPLVASVLPEEYQDIKKRLTKDTAWMWFALANAHKHLHHYIKMAGCLVMCGLKDPKMLYSKIIHRNK